MKLYGRPKGLKLDYVAQTFVSLQTNWVKFQQAYDLSGRVACVNAAITDVMLDATKLEVVEEEPIKAEQYFRKVIRRAISQFDGNLRTKSAKSTEQDTFWNN